MDEPQREQNIQVKKRGGGGLKKLSHLYDKQIGRPLSLPQIIELPLGGKLLIWTVELTTKINANGCAGSGQVFFRRPNDALS
mgnify:CR=1 FL=1